MLLESQPSLHLDTSDLIGIKNEASPGSELGGILRDCSEVSDKVGPTSWAQPQTPGSTADPKANGCWLFSQLGRQPGAGPDCVFIFPSQL